MDSNWFAIQTQSLFERKIEQRLHECGITVFLPTYTESSKRKDRKELLTKPLFSGYLFVNIPYEERVRVLSIARVIRLLGIVPDHDIESLQSAMLTKAILKPVEHIPDGSRVRVIRGSFEGYTGLLSRHTGNCRVVLAFDPNLQFTVELDESDLEVITS